MKFEANYEIDCGVSTGMGLKYPDQEERSEQIDADSPKSAIKSAMDLANHFADDYFSNPNTGLTTVQLTSLRGPEGKVTLDPSQTKVARSMVEHVLSLSIEK